MAARKKKPKRRVAGGPGGKPTGRKKASSPAKPGRGAAGAKGAPGKNAPGKKSPGKKSPGKKAKKPAGPARTPKPSRAIAVTPRPVDTPAPDVSRLDAKDRSVRLNRFLAEAGLCSRRKADELIESGVITVNGEPVTELGLRVDPDTDEVRHAGEPVVRERKVHVLLNKPSGVVCTNARNEQRPRAVDLVPQIRGRVYTVGRLDADSEGLILLTNDGDFAQALTHPSHGVPKTYAVLVRGRVKPEELEKVRGGVWLSEGRTGGAKVWVERQSKDKTYLKVVLREGRNREIRRVFAKLDHPVQSLKRVRIGSLSLHGLGRGKWRFVTGAEVRELLASAAGEEPERRGSRSGRKKASRGPARKKPGTPRT